MTKLILALSFVFLPIVLAQASPEVSVEVVRSTRSMVIDSLVQYGQQLFDRGDYAQATQVFNRALYYDPQNSIAQDYLRSIKTKMPIKPPVVDIRRSTVIDLGPVVAKPSNAQVVQMKQQLEAKNKLLMELKDQIATARAHSEVKDVARDESLDTAKTDSIAYFKNRVRQQRSYQRSLKKTQLMAASEAPVVKVTRVPVYPTRRVPTDDIQQDLQQIQATIKNLHASIDQRNIDIKTLQEQFK